MRLYLIVGLACISHIAFKASRVVVPLFALQLGASPLAVGFLFSMYALFPFLLAVPAGRLSDRVGTRLPVLIGAVGLAAGLSLPTVSPTLPTLFCSAALIGMLYIFHIVAMQHLMGALGGSEDRTRNYSVYSLGIGASAFLGPLIAGLSIDAIGYSQSYQVLAVLPLLPAAVFLLWPRLLPRPAPRSGAATAKTPTALYRDVPLRRTLLIGGIIETGLELYSFYMPIHGHAMGLSASAIGMIMATYALAALLIRVFMPAMVRRAGEETVLFYSLLVAALTYLALPFVSHPVLLALVSFLLGMGLGTGSPLSMILIYNHAPVGRAGEAMGMRQSVNKFSESVAPMVFGAIGSTLGMIPVFWGSAILLAGGAVALRKWTRR